MKKILSFLITFTSIVSVAQNATEVYLFDFIKNDSLNTYVLKNPINISVNEGVYDNQPSFLLDGSGVLFASTRNDQTDIALYNIEKQTKTWLTNTLGSEYSPLQTPNKKYFSAIRLDEDETQLLWIYPFNRRKSKILIENLKVGYHTWFDKKTVVSFVLNDPPTMEVSNLKYKIKYPIGENIGRSIHKIPSKDLVSYISHKHKDPEIHSINPINSDEQYIVDALKGSQDMAWTPDGTILMGKAAKLYKFTPEQDKDWVELASLKEFGLNGITRLAISPLGNKIAIVVEEEKSQNTTSEN